MQIRFATPADSAGIVAVVRSVYDEYGFTWDPDAYHADLYDLEGHYFSRGHPFWVAEEDDQILGTVALELFDRLPGEAGATTKHEGRLRAAGADCSLERLYVTPLARRRGLGRRLTAVVIETARKENRTLLELWSDKRFEAAHALYLEMGAQIIADRICHDPDQSPEWGLAIDLRGLHLTG